MLDANEIIHADSISHLRQTFAQYNLLDAFVQCHPNLPAIPDGDPIVTYQRGHRRLDYIFISRQLSPSIRCCGYLPFGKGLLSDHRSLFLDLDTSLLFGSHSTILPEPMRLLTTKHPLKVQKYLTELQHQFQQHNIEERSLRLYTIALTSTTMTWTDHHQHQYNNLNVDITRSMLAAENRCGYRTHH